MSIYSCLMLCLQRRKPVSKANGDPCSRCHGTFWTDFGDDEVSCLSCGNVKRGISGIWAGFMEDKSCHGPGCDCLDCWAIRQEGPLSDEDILLRIASQHDITVEELRSSSRQHRVIKARQDAILALHSKGLSRGLIGELLNRSWKDIHYHLRKLVPEYGRRDGQ